MEWIVLDKESLEFFKGKEVFIKVIFEGKLKIFSAKIKHIGGTSIVFTDKFGDLFTFNLNDVQSVNEKRE